MYRLPSVLLLVTSFWLAAANSAAAVPEDPAAAKSDEDQAATIVESLGGSATRDPDKPGQPVVGIIFYRIEFPPGTTVATKPGKPPLTHLSDADVKRLMDLSLPELESFGVSYLQVTDAGIEGLTNFPKLKYVGLAGSAFTDRGFETVTNLGNVVDLGFRDSSLTNQGLVHCDRLKKIHSLDLSGNKGITDAGLVHLERLEFLHDLNLSGTSVTDTGLVHLAKLSKLEVLSLDRTQITDAGLVHLLALPKLSQVSLVDTAVSEAGVTQLQQQSPMLRIVHNKVRGVVSFETAAVFLYVLIATSIVLFSIAGVHFVVFLGARSTLASLNGQGPEFVTARLFIVPLAWFVASLVYHCRQFVEGKWIEAVGRSGQAWTPLVDSFPALTYAVWITWAVCTIICACYYFRILHGKYSLVPRLVICFLVVALQLFLAVVLNAVFGIITYLGGGGPMDL